MRILDPHSAILRTGVLLLGIPILFQLATLAFLMHVQGQTTSAEEWELHSKEVIRRASNFAHMIAEAHSAQRANAIFRDPGFERGSRDRMKEASRRLRELRQLVGDNPGQVRQLDRVAAAAEQYQGWYREMEGYAAAGDWNRYVEVFKSLRGKALLDALERELVRFNAEEERLDVVRRAEAESARRRERLILGFTAAVAVVLAAALLVAFARGFSARLGRIAENGERLATGEALLPPLEGRDEVAAVDRVLHHTSARLESAARAEREHTAELEARREELERLNKELQFKTQESEMFVYSVSHDLRSPLVNLQGFTRELAMGCGELRSAAEQLDAASPVRRRLVAALDGDMKEAVGFIQTAVTRLSGIVDALLRLSRAGRVEFRPETVDLDEVVARILRSMRVSIEEKGAEVRAAALPPVKADRVAIEQVLANLLVNAVNYLDPNRPGTIRVAAVDGAERPGFVTVSVQDNGLGIPQRYLSKLFMPFERLHGNRVKGEGIGLALVKRIVERHDGRIWVESKENEGTTFFVSLPAA